MPRLFGTDGVRGVANADLTPDLALALGRAAGTVLAPGGGEIVVGRDTRISGPMLEGALVAGLCSAGVDVRCAGIITSPAVSWLTVDSRARAGAMISASHNPIADNGIKFFSSLGAKVAVDVEDAIEAHMEEPPGPRLGTGPDVGTSLVMPDAADRYVEHLVSTITGDLAGMRIVLDCAYGAAWQVAPRAFEDVGATVVAMHAEPDGARINVECGSTSMDRIAERVVEEEADLGLAFDGDADRVLAVDERGNVIDGDRILALCALSLSDAGELDGNVVVATVMSNLGFRRALEERGIEVLSAPVGDKLVAEAMSARDAVLGGEQSGHIIFSRHAATGDGVLTGLQVASFLASLGQKMSDAAHIYDPYPQVLINVEIARRSELEAAEQLWDDVRKAEDALGSRGRVLVRASGTEPLVRVMVEAGEADQAQSIAEDLAASVERHLG
jgi:phosphoglucosamine mutase